jgi:hypothetical protein
MRRLGGEAETACYLASRRGFPGGEVMPSISDSDCFLLAVAEDWFYRGEG